MPADEYVGMASDPHVLGNPLLKTQHFIGVSKWEKVSDTEVIGWHQLRVPHQRFTDETRKEVAVKGHAHGSNQHWYRKVDNVWKFAGLAVEIRWGEFEFDKVFASGEEKYSDEQKQVEGTQIATGVAMETSNLPQNGDLKEAKLAANDPSSAPYHPRDLASMDGQKTQASPVEGMAQA